MEKWISAIREFYDGRTTDLLPSVIFGSGRQLAQSLQLQQRIRIGMTPCISTESPYSAMGLMTLLAFLLERWGEVRVYRLFFKTDADPKTYQWHIADSQYGEDDWVFDALDENAVLSATLNKDVGMWRWSITLENDLAEEDKGEMKWVYEAPTLAGLVNQLSKVADDIIAQFEVNKIRPIAVPTTQADDATLAYVLEGVFRWQMHLLLLLYGKGWAESDIQKELDALIAIGNRSQDDFGAWAVSQVVAHALRTGYAPIPDSLVIMLSDYPQKFPSHTLYPSILIGRALFNMGHPQQAYTIFDEETERNPGDTALWLIKTDLYRRAGRIPQLLEAYQQAFSFGVQSADLYLQYASILELIEEDAMETFILIDPDDYEDSWLLWEAIEAYEYALELDPDNLVCLQNQTLLLVDVEDTDRLHEAFGALLEKDKTGEYIRTVVDMAYALDDLDPLFDMLEAHVKANPNRIDLKLSLAVLAMHLDEADVASDYLDEAEALTDDETLLADIDRLRLNVDDPEFEEKMGTIYAQVSGGNKISPNDIKFLESVIEKAPLLAEGYLYLAQAYVIWGEKDNALITLKDGYEQLPNHPEIAELLALYEWQFGDKTQAQMYLTAGLSANPLYVPLMARMGQILFELNERDAAKGWLTRAETLSPRDPVLAQVRKFIADAMAKA